MAYSGRLLKGGGSGRIAYITGGEVNIDEQRVMKGGMRIGGRERIVDLLEDGEYDKIDKVIVTFVPA